MSRNSASLRLLSLGSSVVCVRSPVKTIKSGSNESAFTAATAFCSVPSASGFSAGPLKPQCVSESCTKWKSSCFAPAMPAQPARPEANTAPPRPASLRNSLRSIDSLIAVSFWNKLPAGGRSFLAMAAWTLIPDKLEEEKPQGARLGAFAATLVAFFLVEMGDKTQIATAALAARYASIAAVVAGTTLGMMLADVPAVYFGERILRRVPAKTVHRVAAAGFALLGALALVGAG